MKANWRSVAIVPVIGIALVLSSCSGDQSNLITNPSIDLNRRAPLFHDDEHILSCRVKALDYFGQGGMPFVVSCEDMGDATAQATHEEYNDAGCLVVASGVVTFPGTSGHTYNFTATTSDCQHDGGMLRVCSTELGGCIEVPLPRLLIVEPRKPVRSMR